MHTHTHTHTHTHIYIYKCPTLHQVKTDGEMRGLRVRLRSLSWTSALHQIFTDHTLWIRSYTRWWGFPGGTVGKNLPTSAGDTRDLGLIPVLGRCPVGNGNPLQYSCLENPMDKGAWWATVHGVVESGTQLSDWAQHHTSTGWWGYSSEQKRPSLPDWHLYSDIGAQEAECNWGLASFKPWFSRSRAMCLRANQLISLNLVFSFFHLRSGSGMIRCMSHACSMRCTVRSYAPSTWKLTDVSLGSQGWLSLWSKADTYAQGLIVLTFIDGTLAYGAVS